MYVRYSVTRIDASGSGRVFCSTWFTVARFGCKFTFAEGEPVRLGCSAADTRQTETNSSRTDEGAKPEAAVDDTRVWPPQCVAVKETKKGVRGCAPPDVGQWTSLNCSTIPG